MTVTKAQAMTAREFHFGQCTKQVGPRGGVTWKTETWRRNGMTKTWKTRPDHFSVPIKYGLYGYSYLDHANADEFHIAEDCDPRIVSPQGTHYPGGNQEG